MVDRLVLHSSNHYHPHTHVHPHPHHHHVTPLLNRKKKVKRLSSTSQLTVTSSTTTAVATPTVASTTAVYYPSAYITNPCDQLFGPPSQLLFSSDCRSSTTNYTANDSLSLVDDSMSTAPSKPTADAGVDEDENHLHSVNNDESATNVSNISDRFEYIPAPKWTKIQNSILEELFKKSRYPKSSELKTLAQRFHVMDSDIEVKHVLNGCKTSK